MKLTGSFPNHITWRINVLELSSGQDLFKGKSLRHLKKAFSLLKESNYQFVFEAVSEELIAQFAPLHRALMLSRGSDFVANFAKLLAPNQWPYQALSLYEGSSYIGGMIFRLKEKSINLCYRVLPYKVAFYLPAPLARLSDILLVDEAIKQKKEYYSLGMDRNPYGHYGSVGLANYKLMMNARPYISSKVAMVDEIEWNGTNDILAFEGHCGSNSTHVKLCLVDSHSLDKYQFLKKDFLTTDIISASGETLQW
ncbi:MAG: hypothetical protein HY817_04340 [Candidatus Abawacabacteria bacterium]|nr:hypothetical protein [Candidatus Abawacabacteria bacterium]